VNISRPNCHRWVLKEIFVYRNSSDDVICDLCVKAKPPGDFATGKRWDDWKLDYLKRHLTHKTHVDSVAKLRNIHKGSILRMLTESQTEREVRMELAQRKTSKPEQVKVLIDSIILAIKLNA